MEDYQQTRDYILQLTHVADLTVRSTLLDLKNNIHPDDWSNVEELAAATNFTQETTILELLAAIQSADASPEND
jgi:hypothetical protein